MAKLKNKELVIGQPVTLAASLYTLQEQIKFLEDQADEVKGQLMENMKKQGVKTVKLDNGTLFTRAERQTLKITDQEAAEKWADEHNTWKVDTNAALQILRRSLKKLPKFFSVSTSEYLVIKH